MAIKNLNDRYPELGRIRLGDKEVTSNKKVRPRKLTQLRFTSNDEVSLKAIASQHGGQVAAWEKGEQAFELYTETSLIPVMLPNDPLGDTPIYERWGSGGVQRRCDGERCLVPQNTDDGGHMVEQDCACLAEGLTPGDAKDTKACKITIRLRLVLPDVPGLGVWLCTSHSWIGALELPGQVAMLDALRARGQMVPAEFGVEQRTLKKPWESFTREFIVPVIRVRQSLAQIMAAAPQAIDTRTVDELQNPAPAALAVAEPAALEAPKPGPAPDPPGSSGPGMAVLRKWSRAGLEPADLPSFTLHLVGANPGDLSPEQANTVLEAVGQVGDKHVVVYGADGPVWSTS